MSISGFQEFHGVGIDEIFTPLLEFLALRNFVVLSAAGNLELHESDVETAFRDRRFEGDISMKQAKAVVNAEWPEVVCEGLKAQYAFK